MVRLIQRARNLRVLLWAGVVVFVAGAVLDLAVHVLLPPAPFPLVNHHSPAENLAHTITFVGMVLLLAGVVTVPRPQPSDVPAAKPASERR